MSYASCLNNRFAKQTIENLTVSGTLTVTGDLLLSSAVQSPLNIKADTATLFYSKLLPMGQYLVRGTIGIAPVNGNSLMKSFIICESSTSTKYPLSRMQFLESSGLIGAQYLPFTSCYKSDGIHPVTFTINVSGGDYFTVAEYDNAIHCFAIV